MAQYRTRAKFRKMRISAKILANFTNWKSNVLLNAMLWILQVAKFWQNLTAKFCWNTFTKQKNAIPSCLPNTLCFLLLKTNCRNQRMWLSKVLFQVHVRQHHLHFPHHDGHHVAVPADQDAFLCRVHIQGTRCFSRRSRWRRTSVGFFFEAGWGHGRLVIEDLNGISL